MSFWEGHMHTLYTIMLWQKYHNYTENYPPNNSMVNGGESTVTTVRIQL